MNLNKLIGREEECLAFSEMMGRRENVIISGVAGAGKTALLHHVLNTWHSGPILFSQNSMTMKASLINFLSFSGNERAPIRGRNIPDLKKRFYAILHKGVDYVIFDHLGRVGPRFCGFLEYLMDSHVPLVIVCRSLNRTDIGHLEDWLLNFKKLEISSLNRAQTDTLLQELVPSCRLHLAEKNHFAEEVFRVSRGNPGIIKELCILAGNGPYQKDGFMDVKLLDLDRRIREITHRKA